MFVRQPTNRIHWSPFIGQPETGEPNPVTLEKCINWHDTLTTFQRNRNRPCPPRLDFDGTMAFLDNEERLERGLASVDALSQESSGLSTLTSTTRSRVYT